MIATETKPKLVRYRWISYFDDLIEKRVSDWDHAATCTECGKSIVHVCYMSNGAIIGKACARQKLGLKQRTIDAVIMAQEQRKRDMQSWKRTCEEGALPTIQEAIVACRKRNWNYENGKDAGEVWVAKFSTGFYAVPKNCSSQLYDADEIMDLP